MADTSWRNLELWERVKWARSQRFDSASAAAQALDMKEGTYRCYERGPGSAKFIPLDYHYARKFGQLFRVRWEWMLEGLGEPWLTKPKADEAPEEGGAPNLLRTWREFRGLTVADLAKKAGTNAQTINDLESGTIELSDKWLGKLAGPLSTTRGRLLDINPYETDTSLFDAVEDIPSERRVQALEILKTFRRTR
ncbi:MAG TPA: helix-turn-helix domain-containing protein [Caulobacteraceae bacterium]|jgi:transcriptional regulator with XRE-family HTH domain